MTQSTEDLQAKFEQAEAKAQKLQSDKDEALQNVRDRFSDKQRQATDKAAEAQKAWADAVAADALRDRPDGAKIAEALGLTL